MHRHRIGRKALLGIAGQPIELFVEDVRFDLYNVNVEFVALLAPAQDLAHHFDSRYAATDDDDRGPTLSRGKLVESARDPHSITDGAQPQRILVRTLDTKGCPHAAGSNQAGVIRQRQPALRNHRAAVAVDPGHDVLHKRVAVTVNAFRTRQHDALAALHPGQYLVDIGGPFKIGAGINDGHVVIGRQAGCGDKAGKIAADYDDMGSGWGHVAYLETVVRRPTRAIIAPYAKYGTVLRHICHNSRSVGSSHSLMAEGKHGWDSSLTN